MGRPCEVSSAPQEVLEVYTEDSTTTWEVLVSLVRILRKLIYQPLMNHRLRGPDCLPSYSRQREVPQARATCCFA